MPFDTDLVTTSSDAQAPTKLASTAQLDAALKLLLEGDFRSRWEATKQLPTLGKPTIAHLVLLLEDDDIDWEIRWFAARTLGNFTDPEALASLVRLLERTCEPELITIAAEGISRFGAEGITALVQLSKNPSHRVTAMQALAGIRHKAALPPLLAAAQDENAEVRSVALSALGHFRDPDVDAVLVETVQDPAASVRQEAITHLGLRAHLLATVDLVAILQPRLQDTHLEVAQATAIALGRLGTDTAIATLAQALQSPSTPESLQTILVRALGWIEQTDALDAILAARLTAPLAVQLGIVEALPRFEAPLLKQRAAAALCDWLTQLPNEASAVRVIQAIALALGDLQPPQAQALLETLAQTTDEQTRLYAEAAIRKIADSL
ncbi:MAG: HEAT repeat domain-containing protein [Leptolyngbyaceae cyanobacterium]